MAKIAVVYWSGTGNTEKMAETFLEEVKAKGCEGELFFANEFSADNLGDFDGFAFGCPAMGNEALEDGEFEPMFEEVETKLEDKPACGRVNLTEREAGERIKDFEGIENCMTSKEACQEAGRCLRCDHFGYGIFKGGRATKW